MPPRIIRRVALESSSALPLRSTCTRARSAVGSLLWHHFSSGEHMHVSAEHISDAPVLSSGARRASKEQEQDENDLVDNETTSILRLTAAMARCRALLQRLCRSILENNLTDIQVVENGDAKLLDELLSVLQKIGTGKITSIRTLFIAVQEAFPLSASLEPHTADGRALASMKKDFERELLFVETPEVECACFDVSGVHCNELLVRLDCQLHIAISGEQLGEQRRWQIPTRWMWAEVVGVDAEGAEVDSAPRIKLDSAPCPEEDPFARRQDLPKGAISTARPGREDIASFRRQMTYSPGQSSSAQLLRALATDACALKIYLRVDWPGLLPDAALLCACRISIAILKPE